MPATSQHKPKDLKRVCLRVFVTLLSPSLIVLPFIPEFYLPIESAFWRHMIRIVTCFTLMTLASKFFGNLRYKAICTTVEVVAILGTLFFPPSDAPFNQTNSPIPESSYEPYMALNAWVGYQGDGWFLSMVALGLAYAVHVLWRIAIREEVSFPVVCLPAWVKARRGNKKSAGPIQLCPPGGCETGSG